MYYIMAQSYYKLIYDFWITHIDYWIPITDKDKLYIDTKIYSLFFNKEINKEYKYKYIINNKEEQIGYIIFNDQFSRNMNRYNGQFSENDILHMRQSIIKSAHIILNDYKELNHSDIIICLMPYKHLGEYKYIFKYFESKQLCIDKFYYDTYKKYVLSGAFVPKLYIKSNKDITDNDILAQVCEFYAPLAPMAPNCASCATLKELKKNLKIITKNEKYIISLSGGVDSSVITYLLSLIINNNNIIVIHIIYGNRKESEIEFNVVKKLCNMLNIKLYYIRIKYLKRANVEREFYENITRDIRFNSYKYLNFHSNNIILGHIKEDIIENIWTNFATGTHFDNLEGMKICGIYNGLNIFRPFLYINKEQILTIAHKCGISYLLNTTPIWSNRGKFRNELYPQIKKQYNIQEDKTIEIAKNITNKYTIAIKLLYNPIIDYYKLNGHLLIDFDNINLIDISGWKYIFQSILNIGTSWKTLNYLIQRLNNEKRLYTKECFVLNKTIQLKIEYINIDSKLYVKILIGASK